MRAKQFTKQISEKRLDPEMLRMMKLAKAKFPMYDEETAFLKYLLSSSKTSDAADSREDRAIGKLEKDVGKLDKRVTKLEKGSKLKEAKKEPINFTADDIKALEGIRDLQTLKDRAFALISKPSQRPMKPEKVQWFKNALDRITNPTAVIKLMYDLLLSGEGYGVIGSRYSTNPSSYRQRFNEGIEDSDEAGIIVMEESAQPREKVGRIIRRVLGDKLVWNPDYSVLYKNTRYSKTQRVDYYAMKSIKVLASHEELPELRSMLKAELEKAGYPVYDLRISPLQIAFQTRSPVQIIEPSEGINENAEELNVGDDVIITGPVEHKGETGVIDSFGQDNRFVVVNLYNHGKKSFHSSDVSYNDYAGSDEEEAEMYDRDPEFRDWAARQDVDEDKVGSWVVHKDGKFLGRFATRKGAKAHAEKHGATVASSEYYNDHVKKVEEGWGAEPAAARHREQMTAVAQVLQKYKNDPVKSKIANYLFVNNWNAQAIEKELANPNAQQKFQANIDKYEQQVGPVKDWSDSMAADYLQGDQGLEEMRKLAGL